MARPEPRDATRPPGPLTKEMIALAVSATNGCTYCIRSHTAAARKLGMDDAMLGELMAVVGTFNQTNRLADGYQVEVDDQLMAASSGRPVTLWPTSAPPCAGAASPAARRSARRAPAAPPRAADPRRPRFICTDLCGSIASGGRSTCSGGRRR